MNTDELIASLAEDNTQPTHRMPSPLSLWSASLGFAIVYGIAVTMLLGIRSDLTEFMMAPLTFIELWLMFAILAASLWSAVCLVYPDHGGKTHLASLPYLLFLALIVLLIVQMDTFNMDVFMQEMPSHMMCFSCLAASTFIPACLLFVITQKGATTAPLKSGAYIVTASVSIGALALRLHEPTNDMAHIIMSHYAPMLLLAAIGAGLGRIILKW